MNEVWVLTYYIEYEGSTLIDAFSSIDKVKEWIRDNDPEHTEEKYLDQATVEYKVPKQIWDNCYIANLVTVK